MTGQGLLDLQNKITDTLSKTIEDEGGVDKKEIIKITKKCMNNSDMKIANINVLVENVEAYLSKNYHYDEILDEYTEEGWE